MTVFWDLIWAVLVGVFIANMLTIDSITETQLEGMDEDNPLSKDDQTKNAIAKISVLEHRFKYALANASKEEDRLTQQDVKAAAEKVSFLQMFIDPETVYKRYMNEYMPQMEAKFEQKLQEAREAGITNEFLIAQYPDAKMIRPLAEAVATGKQKGPKIAPHLTTRA